MSSSGSSQQDVDARPAGNEVAEYSLPGEPPRDAIGEEDHDIPLWFNVSFYGMLVVGLIYLVYYTLSGWSQVGQYEAEVAAFDARYAEFADAAVDANPLRGQADAIAAGKQTFDTICAACHLATGKGLIGPSLVDPYWKYGSDDAAQFASVADGRPAGMPPWGTQLKDPEIWAVLAYVETLPREAEPGVGAPAEPADGTAATATGS